MPNTIFGAFSLT